MRARHEVSKSKARRIQRARRREEKSWASKSSAVTVAYACICDRNPAGCRAANHDKGEHQTSAG